VRTRLALIGSGRLRCIVVSRGSVIEDHPNQALRTLAQSPT
jgi:hypothetical protein